MFACLKKNNYDELNCGMSDCAAINPLNWNLILPLFDFHFFLIWKFLPTQNSIKLKSHKLSSTIKYIFFALMATYNQSIGKFICWLYHIYAFRIDFRFAKEFNKLEKLESLTKMTIKRILIKRVHIQIKPSTKLKPSLFALKYHIFFPSLIC